MGFISTSLNTVIIAVSLNIICRLFTGYFRKRQRLPLQFGGHVEPGFEAVERAFRELFEDGTEKGGAAFSAYYRGELVVDLWGGYADRTAGRPWAKDTMSVVFSSTKGVCALCLAMLVDRGLVSYEDLVTKYWPGFGQHEKDTVTIGMVLNHEAGLVALDSDITMDHVKDWRLMSKLFEEQKPNWTLGTANGYHAYTFGWLVDQMIRRIDPKGRSVSQFFKDEVAIVHDIEFFIGTPPELLYRLSRLTKCTWREMLPVIVFFLRSTFTNFAYFRMIWKLFTSPKNSLHMKMINNAQFQRGPPGTMVFNNLDMYTYDMPSLSGVGTARALARIFSLVTSDKGIFRNKNMAQMLASPVLMNELDIIQGFPMSWGYGFWHWKKANGHYQFGHPGIGGQIVKLDIDNYLAFAYIRNYLAPDIAGSTPSLVKLEKALYNSITNCE